MTKSCCVDARRVASRRGMESIRIRPTVVSIRQRQRPSIHIPSQTMRYLGCLLLLLLISFVPLSHAQVGVSVCACQPSVYTFQFHFDYNCSNSDIKGAGIVDSNCFVQGLLQNNTGIQDFVPIRISAVDIIELNQQLRPINSAFYKDGYINNETIRFVSIAGQPSQAGNMTVDNVPKALQLSIVGQNRNEEDITNVWIILFDNKCGYFNPLTTGQQIGWTKLVGLEAPLQYICPAAPPSPTVVSPTHQTVSPVTTRPIISSPTSRPTVSPVTARPIASAPTSRPTVSQVTARPIVSSPTSRPTSSPTKSSSKILPRTARPTIFPSTASPIASPVPTSRGASQAPVPTSSSPTTKQPASVLTEAPSRPGVPPIRPTCVPKVKTNVPFSTKQPFSSGSSNRTGSSSVQRSIRKSLAPSHLPTAPSKQNTAAPLTGSTSTIRNATITIVRNNKNTHNKALPVGSSTTARPTASSIASRRLQDYYPQRHTSVTNTTGSSSNIKGSGSFRYNGKSSRGSSRILSGSSSAIHTSPPEGCIEPPHSSPTLKKKSKTPTSRARSSKLRMPTLSSNGFFASKGSRPGFSGSSNATAANNSSYSGSVSQTSPSQSPSSGNASTSSPTRAPHGNNSSESPVMSPRSIVPQSGRHRKRTALPVVGTAHQAQGHPTRQRPSS